MADIHTSLIEIDILHGKPVPVSNLVTRVTAPNPGLMTGPGTNTYLVGRDTLAIVDPGPDDNSHVEAVLSACKDRQVAWIIATHTHRDHSPAGQALARATGAPLVGATIDDRHQDTTFKPSVILEQGYRIEGPDFTLEAIHTPGHVGNHYCLLLEEERLLFTGDHIMQGATVVVIPPSGHMGRYLESLSMLLSYDIELLAPAHGHIMDRAHQVIKELIAHRLGREAKVLDALQKIPDSSLEELVAEVYTDVDKKLHKVAQVALWAHLLKLEEEGRVRKHAQGLSLKGQVFKGKGLKGQELWSLNEVEHGKT